MNKDKRVSNGNYLWISCFYSYLNDRGRAGFVMSSQASSAGNDEKTVRQKLVQTHYFLNSTKCLNRSLTKSEFFTSKTKNSAPRVTCG